MRLQIKGEVSEVKKYISQIQLQELPFASSLALTRTAEYSRKQIIDEMRRQFDRPKPSTLSERSGPIYIKTASKSKYPNDYSEVRVKDQPLPKGVPPIVWLAHQIYGGTRAAKRSEDLLRNAGILPRGWYTVPGEGARMDRYGNMSTGQIQQILSALQSARDSRQNTRYAYQGITDRKGNTESRNAKSQKKYFLALPSSLKTRHLAPGVWQRYGRKDWQVRPVLIFVRRVSYRRRIRFYDICQQSAQYRFKFELHVAMKRALSTRR